MTDQTPKQPAMVFDDEQPTHAGVTAPAAPAQIAQPSQTTPASNGMVFDAAPAPSGGFVESGDVDSGLHKPASSFADNLATSFGSSAAQSLDTLGRIGSHIPGVEYVSDKIGDLLGLQPLPKGVNPYDVVGKAVKPDTTTLGGKAGYGLEGLGEFVTGEAALKGLSVADRMMEAAKATKILEKYPMLARLATNAKAIQAAEATGNIVRQTALSSGQSALHDESALTGAEYGVAGGALGETLSLGSKFLLSKTPAELAQRAASELETLRAENRPVLESLTKQYNSNAVQAAENSGATVSDAAKVGDYRYSDAADDVRKVATPIYDAIDKASGNKFSGLRNQEKTALQVIKNPASVEVADAATKTLEKVRGQIDDLFNNNNSDLSKDTLKKAQDLYRRGSTLDELSARLDNVFSTATEAKDLTTKSAIVRPAKFTVDKINAAFNAVGKDRLAETLGPDGVDKLYQLNEQFRNFLKTEKSTQDLISSAAALNKAHPTSVILGGGAGYLMHLLGMSNPVTAGLATSSAALHWMYTHPEVGTKVLAMASKSAPYAAQAAKHYLYHPEKGLLNAATGEPVGATESDEQSTQ